MRVHTLILYVSLCVWWVGVVGVGGSRGHGWVVGMLFYQPVLFYTEFK